MELNNENDDKRRNVKEYLPKGEDAHHRYVRTLDEYMYIGCYLFLVAAVFQL